MAAADPEEIEAIVRPCGLGKSKARDISGCMKMLIRPSRTNISPVIYQPMTEIASFFRRNDLPQFHLYFLRLLDSVYKTHAIHQTDTVGICYDRRLSEHIPHDQVRARMHFGL